MFDLNEEEIDTESQRRMLPCGYINGSRRLIARVAQRRIILDVRSTPLSTTDEITDNDSEITAATILITSKPFEKKYFNRLFSFDLETYNINK